MAQPVVHVEIIGRDPARLRAYYADLFGWDFSTGGPVSPAVSEAGNYGFSGWRSLTLSWCPRLTSPYGPVARNVAPW